MPVNARILIVEDDFATRQSLAALLRQMGHMPIVADRADDGMRVLRSSENLDIIITDVVMPGMNGIEFSEHVRKARPGLPIVLVTGDADWPLVQDVEAFDLGRAVTRKHRAMVEDQRCRAFVRDAVLDPEHIAVVDGDPAREDDAVAIVPFERDG